MIYLLNTVIVHRNCEISRGLPPTIGCFRLSPQNDHFICGSERDIDLWPRASPNTSVVKEHCFQTRPCG